MNLRRSDTLNEVFFMAEHMVDRGQDTTLGKVESAREVIEVIAGIAAAEVGGVAAMRGNFATDVVEKLGKKNHCKERLANVVLNLLCNNWHCYAKIHHHIQVNDTIFVCYFHLYNFPMIFLTSLLHHLCSKLTTPCRYTLYLIRCNTCDYCNSF